MEVRSWRVDSLQNVFLTSWSCILEVTFTYTLPLVILGDLYSKINGQKVPFPEEQVLDWFVQLCLAIKVIFCAFRCRASLFHQGSMWMNYEMASNDHFVARS
jgi:hypothetical protein